MKQTLLPGIVVSIALLLGVAACAPALTPTATPVSSTATLTPRPVAPVATAAQTPSRPAPARTVPSNLRTDTVEFTTTLSSDDTVAVVDNVQRLDGAKNVQSSGQAIEVTYDSSKTSLDQIIAALEDYGIHVKK